MRYPYVLLDAGATLIGPRDSFGTVYAEVLREFDVDLPARTYEASLYAAMAELEGSVPRGTDRFRYFPGGEEEYWLRFATRAIETATGRPVEPALAQEAVRRLRGVFRDGAAWEVYPDVPPALDALRDGGARLAIVSNWDSLLPPLLDALELTGYFDAVVVSHLEGVEKPDPALFRIALARLGGTADRALHVGDRPDIDLEGARAAGIAAVLVDRAGQLERSLGALPDLATLPELARNGLDGGPP